ncbi:hypothetical protein HOG21_05940 [bacterium]|jgi:hypothetical protein|nr:hypothetical protein [bacterium]
MKKIVFIILSFFIYCSAFANTILDLKTDKNKVKLNESIVLTLDVKTDSPGNIEIIDII